MWFEQRCFRFVRQSRRSEHGAGKEAVGPGQFTPVQRPDLPLEIQSMGQRLAYAKIIERLAPGIQRQTIPGTAQIA